MVRSIQLLSVFFAAPHFTLTIKPRSLWEVVQLVGALLTHPEPATRTQLLTSVRSTPRALVLPADALAMPSDTGYKAGQKLGLRVKNGLILALLGFRESELGMRAAYSKLYSPEKKNSL